jgi:glycosyltransferase involved in cell wall biosynthesis
MSRQTLVVFTSGDLGAQFRLLRYALSFSRRENTRVVLVGGDRTSLPQTIRTAPNISHRFFLQYAIPLPTGWVLLPFYYVFLLLEFLFLVCTLRRIDFFLVSSPRSFADVFAGLLARALRRCRLIVDLASFQWRPAGGGGGVAGLLERVLPRCADRCAVATRSMQLILELRGVRAALAHDPPGTRFRPNRALRGPVLELLGCGDARIVAIPMPNLTADRVRELADIAAELDAAAPQPLALVVFGSEKAQRAFDHALKNVTFAKVAVRFFGLNTDVYSQILACADLGVSFDGSRRGFDIAAELTEMCASGLPIVAYRFGCISEYIYEGENGYFFVDQKGAIEILRRLLCEDAEEIPRLRANCADRKIDWGGEFERACDQLFSG